MNKNDHVICVSCGWIGHLKDTVEVPDEPSRFYGIDPNATLQVCPKDKGPVVYGPQILECINIRGAEVIVSVELSRTEKLLGVALFVLIFAMGFLVGYMTFAG